MGVFPLNDMQRIAASSPPPLFPFLSSKVKKKYLKINYYVVKMNGHYIKIEFQYIYLFSQFEIQWSETEMVINDDHLIQSYIQGLSSF